MERFPAAPDLLPQFALGRLQVSESGQTHAPRDWRLASRADPQGNWCNTSGSTAVAPDPRNNAPATVTDQPLR